MYTYYAFKHNKKAECVKSTVKLSPLKQKPNASQSTNGITKSTTK